MRRSNRAAALVVVAAMATACTTEAIPEGDPPTPSATSTQNPDGPANEAPSVVVVLPARAAVTNEEIERERRDVEEVADLALERGVIASIRTVVPDRSTTVADVLEVVAEQGHDLVCALGPGAARAVRDIARRFPGTKFCGAPGNLVDVPGNALIFDLRNEESAYLAGVASAEVAAFLGPNRGTTPALIVGDSTQANRLQVAFDQGYSISRELAEPATVRVVTSPSVAFDTAESLFDAGAHVIYTSAGRLELGVAQAAAVHGRLVIGTLPPQPVSASEEPTPSEDPAREDDAGTGGASPGLMYLGENLSAALRDTLDELAAGWTGGRRSIGFANGALTLTPGASPLWPRIAAQVLTTRDALVAGQDLQIEGA